MFFLRRGEAGIVDAARFTDDPTITDAVQSGPLMMENGRIHPGFNPASTSRRIRNAVGITRDGGVVFLITHRQVSLCDFSAAARDRHGVTDLLYLDGTISQMYVRPAPLPGSSYPFVTMIAVERMG